MKTKFLTILSSFLLMFAFGFSVQAQSISGTVTDDNGVPLPGATVLVEGTQNGVSTDFDGNYIGSSYAWATTRDWAKFGLLYLYHGNWNGVQVLDPSWVDFTKKPSVGSAGVYGGHFWLNAGGKFPDVPKDMFSCNGFQGQRVWIIPSKDLVIVRTGLHEYPFFDINQFLSE